MSTTRFLIAKFTPDLRRMEPRNFGVIVWSNGEFVSKFAGETTTDGKTRIRPPSHLHVSSPDAYRQWIDYWRTLMSRPSIVSPRGEQIPRNNVDFVNELKSKSREQFVLADGGQLLDLVTPDELPEIANELYAELVALPGERDELHALQALELRRSAKSLLKRTGLSERRDFHEKYSCVCHVGDAATSLEFNYAVHDTGLVAILHRVPQWNLDSVQNTALRFGYVRHQFGLPIEHCASLIYARDRDLSDKATREGLSFLMQFANIVNLADENSAVDAIQKLQAGMPSLAT